MSDPKAIEVTILRHYKEKKSKCSLEALKGRPGIHFVEYKPGVTFDATGYIVLSLNGELLSEKDNKHPLLLLDSTWRLLPQLENALTGTPIYRTLPANLITAYPRVSKIGEDPLRGLASIEALYIALRILGQEDSSLLAHYHWREVFLNSLQAK